MADREIRKLQRTVQPLGTRAEHERLVRDIGKRLDPSMRFTSEAIATLHQVSEACIIELFQNAQRIMLLNKRSTLMLQDLTVAWELNPSMSLCKTTAKLNSAYATPVEAAQSETLSEAQSEAPSDV